MKKILIFIIIVVVYIPINAQEDDYPKSERDINLITSELDKEIAIARRKEDAKARKAKRDQERKKRLAKQKREEQKSKLARENEALKQKLAEERARQRRIAEQERVKKLAEERKKMNIVYDYTMTVNSASSQYKYKSYVPPLGTPEDGMSKSVDRTHILTTDMYVLAVVETAVNTRRSGQFNVVIPVDIYSPNDLKTILIHRGTKYVCKFKNLKKFGETSIEVQCIRAYTPDGRSYLPTKMFAYDQMGRPGIVGRVDNRMWEKYGDAFIISGVSGLGMYLSEKVPDSDVSAVGQYTALNMIELTKAIIEKTIDLEPIVTVGIGSLILLKPQVDLAIDTTLDEGIYKKYYDDDQSIWDVCLGCMKKWEKK